MNIILSPDMRDCITNSLFAAGMKASREAATVLVGAVQSYLENNLKYLKYNILWEIF